MTQPVEKSNATAEPAGSPQKPVILLEEASFSYGGAPSLTGVSARIEAGSAVALVGPNGSGKSTLLRGLLGLVPLSSGRLEILGSAPRAAISRLGYMPQSDDIDSDFPVTLRQVVMMGRYRSIGWFRMPGRVDRDAVEAVLERVGLAAFAERRFGELSGGQQQRGMLARALVSAPSVILLDEPFNGLDQPNRTALLDTLNALRAEGVTIVVSTHDLELARTVYDSVMLLNRQQIAFGPIAQTLTLPMLERTFGDMTVELDEHTVLTSPHGGH